QRECVMPLRSPPPSRPDAVDRSSPTQSRPWLLDGAAAVLSRTCPPARHTTNRPSSPMYLDSYVTVRVHSRHGRRVARSLRRKPTGDGGGAAAGSCHGERVGGAAADCPPGRLAAPAGSPRGGARRGGATGTVPRLPAST